MFNADDNDKFSKKVKEAVILASVCCLATNIVNWGFQELKKFVMGEEKKPEQKPEQTQTQDSKA